MHAPTAFRYAPGLSSPLPHLIPKQYSGTRCRCAAQVSGRLCRDCSFWICTSCTRTLQSYRTGARLAWAPSCPSASCTRSAARALTSTATCNKHADLKTHSATDHVQHIMTARNRPNAPPACSKREARSRALTCSLAPSRLAFCPPARERRQRLTDLHACIHERLPIVEPRFSPMLAWVATKARAKFAASIPPLSLDTQMRYLRQPTKQTNKQTIKPPEARRVDLRLRACGPFSDPGRPARLFFPACTTCKSTCASGGSFG